MECNVSVGWAVSHSLSIIPSSLLHGPPKLQAQPRPPFGCLLLFFLGLTHAMDAVRFLGVGALPAAGSLGCRSTLPLGRVHPYFVRSVPPPGGGAGRRGLRAARPPRAAMGGDLFALDFDGVLCDSCGESSLSAVKVSSVLPLACLTCVKRVTVFD